MWHSHHGPDKIAVDNTNQCQFEVFREILSVNSLVRLFIDHGSYPEATFRDPVGDLPVYQQHR